MSQLRVGVIGCGNIADQYLGLAPNFPGIKMTAVADLNMDVARARAEQYPVDARTVDALLASDDIDVIVNLTIPAAHFEVTRRILQAGKHAFSEKPLVLTLEQGEELRALAEANGLRVGCAPDTFLGAAHQTARAIMDAGTVGSITSGTCHVMSHGMEHWHPNPDFFFQEGAGPVLDIGPYYVTNLIQLLGPVEKVAALTNQAGPTRTLLLEPRAGEEIPIETPTDIHALLKFKSGATITMGTSWDVWSHDHANMELYGTKGTLYVPDPNFFGGDVKITDKGSDPVVADDGAHPFGVPNDQVGTPDERANYRTSGLADMAQAILQDRPHRCSLELAVHCVDVMTSILKSGETHEFVTLSTTCDRPAAMDKAAALALMGK